MSYLGTPPQSGFITTAKQRVTSSTNAYVDLDHSISSLADVIVWVNSVKQDSTNLTLTTSTRITLGATLVSSDIVEIAYLGKSVATQTPGTSTVTSDMLAGSIANSKLANSSITLNGSAVSLGGSATVGGDNKPFFYAFQQNAQNFSTGAHTVVSLDSERYDTDSKFNTSNYRFTPAVAGYYFLYAHMRMYTSTDFNMYEVSIRKNGSNAAKSSVEHDHNGTCSVSTIIESDADDYFDVEVMQNSGSTQGSYVGYQNTYFMGYKLIT